MTDEKDKTDLTPEPPPKKHIPDPYANLTDKDWADAMVRGKEFSDAKDKRIRKAIKGETEETSE